MIDWLVDCSIDGLTDLLVCVFAVVSAALVDAGGEAARAEAASVSAAAADARLELLGSRGKLPTVPALRRRAPAVEPHADLCRWVSVGPVHV